MNKVEANRRNPQTIRVAEVGREFMPTKFGDFTYIIFRTETGVEYPVLLKEPIAEEKLPLVRVHSKCVTGDAFGSRKCDCGPQLHQAMEQVGKEGGIIVYASDHEGRGTGIINKMKAYALQDDQGLDTVEANRALGIPIEARDYGIAAVVLKKLGITTIRLLTNNPHKRRSLVKNGIAVEECVPLEIPVNINSADYQYQMTKAKKMGHTISLPPNGK